MLSPILIGELGHCRPTTTCAQAPRKAGTSGSRTSTNPALANSAANAGADARFSANGHI